MPSNSRSALRRRLLWLLAPFDQGLGRVALWVSHGALAVLIVSGETLRWIDYRDTLISASTLRAVHVLGGFALAIALAVRGGEVLLRAAGSMAARRRVRLRLPAFHWQDLTGARLLHGAWWAVVLLFLLSGLERYTQLRHGTSLLPGLPTSLGWALHRPLLPYLYTVLLINALIRGRLSFRRALAYLYTP